RTLGTAPLSEGRAIFNKAFTSVGAKSITAVYSGEANFASSTSPVLSQNVNQATSTTTLTASPNPSSAGQSVALTASVTPQYSGTPTGTVKFYNGTTLLGTVTLSGGQATLNQIFNNPGTKSISAIYSGDTNFMTSTDTMTQTVN